MKKYMFIYEENGILKIADQRTDEIKNLIIAEFEKDNITNFFENLEINNYISILLDNSILEYFNNMVLYKLKIADEDLHDWIKQRTKINLHNYNYKTNYILDEEIKKIFNYCY